MCLRSNGDVGDLGALPIDWAGSKNQKASGHPGAFFLHKEAFARQERATFFRITA
jgi:hypothetical protein